MTQPWYRNAVIYSLDVETFADSDGDGVGDLRGLTDRLDYLNELGVDCLWLLPLHPTPNRDDGYDVSDYYAVDPRLGTLGDFVVFVEAARSRGIRVLIDLVVNHTSSDHPWFQAARRDPRSPYRDYYIWVERPPLHERRGGLVFPGEQSSNWTYDEAAGAWYWHWFYEHQPDLNTGNPAVREEIRRIIEFWLGLGVSGFRLDAAPFLFKRKGRTGAHPDDPLGFLVELRRFLQERRPDAVFLAEADVSSEEISFFFGDGERMHLLFNFLLNNHLFLALARQSGEPLNAILRSLPPRPEPCQWANFVRNHDELNLSRLAEAERDETFARFAPDPTMRIYGRGIRRRLPPMLQGDRAHVEVTYSLLFSLPGTPVLRYGEEIGMGDDLALPGRLSVRTPMQWSGGANGGFSSAPAERLVRPVIAGGDFGFERINVEDQRNDPDSLLSFVRRLIRTRRTMPNLAEGDLRVLDAGDPAVFAHAITTGAGSAAFLHNLAGRNAAVRLDARELGGSAFEVLLAERDDMPSTGPELHVSLAAYDFLWLRVR